MASRRKCRQGRPWNGGYRDHAYEGILTAALCTALGVGVGVLVRNQVAGVVGTLVWLLILEPLPPLIDDVLANGSILGADGALGGSESDEVSWAGALLVLGVWTGVFMLAGLPVDRRRDAKQGSPEAAGRRAACW